MRITFRNASSILTIVICTCISKEFEAEKIKEVFIYLKEKVEEVLKDKKIRIKI